MHDFRRYRRRSHASVRLCPELEKSRHWQAKLLCLLLKSFSATTIAHAVEPPGHPAKVATWRRVLRGTLCSALFLTALISCCAVLKYALPERDDIPVLSDKLEDLAKRGAEVDTLFIGTSRVYHQVDPAHFDTRMKELGHSTCSYNLAADGMNFPETFYVLDRALKSTPHLKLVVLEVGSMQHVDNQIFSEGSVRSVYWRDWPRTWTIAKSIWRNPARDAEPTSVWTEKLWHQFELMALNMSNLGYGAGHLERWLSPKKAEKERSGPDRGYAPIQRQMSKSDLAIFRERMKSKRSLEELPLRADPELRERFDELVAALRNRGVETCFVYYPAFRRDRPEVPSQAGSRPVPVLDFDNPTAFPDFFREEYYYDTAHLNQKGSTLFTRSLAESVHQALK